MHPSFLMLAAGRHPLASWARCTYARTPPRYVNQWKQCCRIAKFDPFLSLDCAPTPSTLAQSKERKGSNFAIWQPWRRLRREEEGTKGASSLHSAFWSRKVSQQPRPKERIALFVRGDSGNCLLFCYGTFSSPQAVFFNL